MPWVYSSCGPIFQRKRRNICGSKSSRFWPLECEAKDLYEQAFRDCPDCSYAAGGSGLLWVQLSFLKAMVDEWNKRTFRWMAWLCSWIKGVPLAFHLFDAYISYSLGQSSCLADDENSADPWRSSCWNVPLNWMMSLRGTFDDLYSTGSCFSLHFTDICKYYEPFFRDFSHDPQPTPAHTSPNSQPQLWLSCQESICVGESGWWVVWSRRSSGTSAFREGITAARSTWGMRHANDDGQMIQWWFTRGFDGFMAIVDGIGF